MPNEKMTLIERLRNPAWEADGTMVEAKPAKLNVERTRADMLEAAEELERLKLKKRPVAFRVGPFQDQWAIYQDEGAANTHADGFWDHAVSVQGLYVRDGT